MHLDRPASAGPDTTDNTHATDADVAPLSVGVVSDDGFASTVASAIIEKLPDHAMIDGHRRELRVSGASVPLPPTATGAAPLGQWLASVQATDNYDIVLCVSEVPRRLGSRGDRRDSRRYDGRAVRALLRNTGGPATRCLGRTGGVARVDRSRRPLTATT
ncbi:hypothetical protein [Rhodococcoides fascians]|uniref:hypothetical protein n=1 Tax=Rhodococcoides fascians TaxID=1828 RepID=UPI00068C470F|nr:hypothetical protein [Rhodococcus fascians]